MLNDLNRIPEDTLHFDVCIVGGGAAGLTVAEALLGSKLRIALLEGGALKRTKAGQEPFRGEVVQQGDHPELESYRVRALGGMSRIWGGRCIPFDPIDFEERSWIPGSGWPISYADLESYYWKAQALSDAGSYAFDPASALPGSQAEMVPGLDGPTVSTTVERFSKPTNFWTRASAALTKAVDAHVYVNATVTSIRLDSTGERVVHLDVATSDKRKVRFTATTFIVAAGALETARLLLASSDVQPNGIGNAGDHVGRNYMSHLCTTAGHIEFSVEPGSVAYDYERDRDGIYVRRRLWINEDGQRELKTLNTTFRTHLPDPGNPAHGDAILSAMFLAKNLVLAEYGRKFSEQQNTLGDVMAHVSNVARQPFRLTRFGLMWLRRRILAERKLPSVVLGSALNRFALEFHAEQAPNPSSRVTLTDQPDSYGMPRLKVDWQTTDLDIASLLSCYAHLSNELRRTGTGRLDYDPEEIPDRARRFGVVGGHQLGTTRMSATPARGVVDADGRVHGVSNLYITGGAVFCTSSQANPTLTILALALRLADHIRLNAQSPAGSHFSYTKRGEDASSSSAAAIS